MAGTLYVVGIGPGDPELLTLKAVRILKEATCLFVPKGREEGTSLALSIVQKALSLEGKEIVEAYFPMMKTVSNADSGAGSAEGRNELDTKWDHAAEAVISRLDRGIDA